MGKFKNCSTDGSVIGFVVGEDSELEGCVANNNSKIGFLVVKTQSLKELELEELKKDLKFYKQNAPHETAALLQQIENKTESESREIIVKSSLSKKLSAIKDPASIISSILSISANSNIHETVKWLLNHL